MDSRYFAFDGLYLWVSSGNRIIYKVDPINNSVISTIPLPTSFSSYYPLVYNNGQLWFLYRTSLYATKLGKIDTFTGNLVSTDIQTVYTYGMAFDGTCIWATGIDTGKVYKFLVK